MLDGIPAISNRMHEQNHCDNQEESKQSDTGVTGPRLMYLSLLAKKEITKRKWGKRDETQTFTYKVYL
jgi:hypothetical protein